MNEQWFDDNLEEVVETNCLMRRQRAIKRSRLCFYYFDLSIDYQ